MDVEFLLFKENIGRISPWRHTKRLHLNIEMIAPSSPHDEVDAMIVHFAREDVTAAQHEFHLGEILRKFAELEPVQLRPIVSF